MDCFTFVTFLSRVISLLRKEALVRFHLFLPEDLSEKLITLARKEDRELRGEVKPRRRRPIIPIAVDPDAHLGRVGTE